jgi:hypothetical protein
MEFCWRQEQSQACLSYAETRRKMGEANEE